MKNLTIVPLHTYWTKYVGLAAVVILGLALASGTGFIAPIYLKWGLVAGLALVAGSRQRQETDRVHLLRLISLKASFFLLVALLLSLTALEIILSRTPTSLLMIAFTGLAVQIVLFHGLLYFAPETVNDQHTVATNIRANRRLYRMLVILFFVLVLAVAYLAKLIPFP